MPPRPSSSSPLRHPAFRALWLASVFSYVGTWIQDLGESWLMLSLTTSPLPVALLSTCITVPAFVLTLPAGVLADRIDRRRLIVVSQAWLALVAFALAMWTWAGWASPTALLIASAALGIGSALATPAWQSLLPDLLPRERVADAVTLNAVAFNLARATGPAIGGVILGALGPGFAFFLNAVSFLAVIFVLSAYPHIRQASEKAETVRRTEPLREAALAAFREVRRSPALVRCYVAVAAFGFATAGVTALMPSFAKHVLRTDARGYGILIGGLGIGAVLAAFILPRLRAALHARTLVTVAMAAYGVCALALSRGHALPVATLLLIPAGVGWLAAFTTMNALVQLNAPAWVKSRVLALYQVAFLSTWSVGAAVGGIVATFAGIASTLSLFAMMAIAAAALTWKIGLPVFELSTRSDGRAEAISTPPPISARLG